MNGGDVQRPIAVEGRRIIEEFPATRIHAIEIVILEPRTNEDGKPYAWRIERVYLWEIKLFGRYIEKKI